MIYYTEGSEIMNTNTVKITPLFQEVGIDIIEFPQQDKATKLKKDGTPKNIVCNKKKGKKSEVYAIEIPDIKKLIDFFYQNEMWQHYLIFVLYGWRRNRVSVLITFHRL